LFPLTNLSTLSSMLRGYSVPTSTTTTAQASPLSALGGLLTGSAGFFSPQYDKNGNPIANSAPYQNLSTGLQNAYNTVFGSGSNSIANDITSSDTSGSGNDLIST